MNGLSWLLYFADVLPNASSAAMFFGVVSTAVFAVVTLITLLTDKGDTSDGWEAFSPKLKTWSGWMAAALITVSIMIPTKDTFYLIAASEGAEVVVTSDAAKEMMGDVQTIISLQLKNMASDLVKENTPKSSESK